MNNKVNKIIQISSYYPPHLGGLENCAESLSKRLADKKYSVNVITSNIGIGKTKKVNNQYYNVSYLKSIEIAHTPIIFNLPARLAYIKNPSVVHIHIAHAITPEITMLVCKLRRIPYIVHIHLDVDPSGFMGFLLKPYKKYLLSHVLQNASKVICLSELQKKVIVKKYNLQKNKIVVFPNGVSEEYFYERTIRKKNTSTLLFVGRISPQKNLSRLIKAISLMENQCKLQIVGDGEERQKIENLIKELKLNNVNLLGKKTGKELVNLYKKADIFVLPSNKEGIPLVLLEAMAASLPIVASNIDGVNELLANVGVLVDNPSPKTFAQELDKLITNINLQKGLSHKAYNRAKLYDWNRVVKKLEKLYVEVAI